MSINLQSSEYDIAQFEIWPGVRKLILEPKVIEILRGFRQIDSAAAEAGGQLFGYFSEDAMICSYATGPKSKDQRSRYFFKPDAKLEQKDIDTQFAEGMHYFGDWHTHPEANPIPSGLDKRDFNRIVRQSKKQISCFIMIIVGTSNAEPGLFVAVSNGKKIFQLKGIK